MTDTIETDHLENKLGTAAEMSHPALWAFARTLERERDDAILLTEQRDIIEGMYQKVIAAVLDCDPIPACKREDDQLEPPWEVITRIKKQRDELENKLEKSKSYKNVMKRDNAELREQRDRLAEALRRVRDGYGGQITDPDCGCDDCVYLRTIDAALQSLIKQTNES